MKNERTVCRVVSLEGLTPYAAAFALQERTRDLIASGEAPDTLFLLEHSPTITLGRSAHRKNLLSGEGDLAARGMLLVESDRGGDITYHGPGQLVGYPILNLNRHGRDLHLYLRQLERTLISTLSVFGIEGEVVTGRTGVWTSDRKIAAIGIKVSRWVTTHGFSLNRDNDLAPMRSDIISCGISDKDVTSFAELGVHLDRKGLEDAFCGAFTERFRVEIEYTRSDIAAEMRHAQAETAPL